MSGSGLLRPGPAGRAAGRVASAGRSQLSVELYPATTDDGAVAKRWPAPAPHTVLPQP